MSDEGVEGNVYLRTTLSNIYSFNQSFPNSPGSVYQFIACLDAAALSDTMELI